MILLSLCLNNGFSQDAETEYGELKIEGEHITSLILENQDGKTESLGEQDKTVQLPVGKYYVRNLIVSDQDQYSVGTRPKPVSESGWITISKDQPAVIKSGAPLKQKINISKRGNHLVLNYKLIGADGLEYNKTTNTSKPPEFSIYQGDKLITTEQFQYG